jgi:Cu/Zn superoxide dismutase
MRSDLAGLSAFACLMLLSCAAHAEDAVYVAKLQPLNSSVTGSDATGTATFTIKGDQLTIVVDAEGTPPGIMHLQHFHGFTDGKAATCPGPDADKNKDGVIDLIETEPMAGTTMVPFHADPVSMEIPSDTYPSASAHGSYHYEKTVSLPDLKSAFAKAFGGQDLDLDKRVVFIHGVFKDAKLPESAASLGTIPASVTLPIACGKIERQN